MMRCLDDLARRVREVVPCPSGYGDVLRSFGLGTDLADLLRLHPDLVGKK